MGVHCAVFVFTQLNHQPMKTSLPLFLLFILLAISGFGQITTPVIRANFGVDGDMRSNFYNNFVQSGNDDWFLQPGTSGTGQFVIDTTGAAAIVAGQPA